MQPSGARTGATIADIQEGAIRLVEEATSRALVALYDRRVRFASMRDRLQQTSNGRGTDAQQMESEEDECEEAAEKLEGLSLRSRPCPCPYFGRHKSFSLPHRWRLSGEATAHCRCNDNGCNAAAVVPPYYATCHVGCLCRTISPDRVRRSTLCRNVNPNEFRRRRDVMAQWFDEFDDEQKNLVLKKFMKHCGTPQNHYLSIEMEPKLHKGCPPNCCDILSWLPTTLSQYILEFLDPVSLCRCLLVCRTWNAMVSNDLLWQRFCSASQWKLSPVAEHKQQLACSHLDGRIQWKKIFSERFRLWRNWMRGQCHVRTFTGHTQGISCVQFDDTRIVSGSSDKTIKVWDIRTNSPWSVMSLVGHSGTVRCLHLEGNRLVSGSMDCTIKVWDLSSHSTWSSIACKVTMTGHRDTVRCLQVDDEKVVSGSYDKTLKVWDLRTGECKLTLCGHEGAVLCVQYDRSKILSGSADKTIKIWSFVPGVCINTLHGHHDAVTCLQFDTWRIVSGSLDRTIKFWNLATGHCLSTLDWMKSEGHTGVIRCLQADRWRIVSAGDDKTLKVWSLESGQRLVTLKNHTDGVTCLQFNDFVIVSGSYDKTVKLWDFSVC